MMHKPWKGYVFPDVSSNLLEETHDLGHGLILRKATVSELNERNVDWAFRMWPERRGSSIFLNQRRLFENNGTEVSGSILQNPLEWRHAVIECAEGNVFFWWVNVAFAISTADLRMGLVSFADGGGSSPFVEFSMLNVRNSLGGMFVDYKLPSVDDLPEIRENLSLVLESVSGGISSEVASIIQIFLSLDNLPDSAPLKILGYFSVIEGLLSHSPQPSDRVDSIQRQLIRNINLLNNRLKKIGRAIDFSAFGETKIEKVLGKLYGYRSAVAHGGSMEGSLEDIAKITGGASKKDQLWVHDWVRHLTKKLIFAAIVEPELVRDLK
jgi:hypothetical protein